jgi:hypothetical protein
MSEVTRNSVFAIKEEVTEGTPLKPTAGGDGYVALQEGFTMEPTFEELTSSELQAGSIGLAKPALGLENPTGSIAHYLRHSGTEGTAPDFGLLIESCLGTETVNGTERLTAAASTTSLVKLASGGADFDRGFAMLIKDATNNYSVRNVLSMATNDATLAFNLANAPAIGLGVGKCVNYKPATSTPSFTSWLFRGNGGAIETMAGCKVNEMSISCEAGAYINCDFSFEGTQYYFDPILIDATNNKLDVDEGAGQLTATITSKLYKDPHQLAEEIQSQLNSVLTAAATCTYSDSTGKFTLTAASGTFSILWNTGTNTAVSLGTTIGFAVAADDTGALTYTSDNAISFASYHTAAYDSADPLVAKSNQVMLGSATDNSCFEASTVNVTVSNSKADIKSVCADSGKSGSFFNSREVTVEIVSLLNRYDAKWFKKFRQGDSVQFAYTGGSKTGVNWDAGKVINMFSPTMTISSFALGDSDGLVTLNMTLKAYVSQGLGEFFINFL